MTINKELLEALKAVQIDAVLIGASENAISNTTLAKVDAAIAKAEQSAVSEPTHRTTGWVAPKDHYSVPVLFNPYTGEPRDARDIASDPQGILIMPLGKVEMLAAKPAAAMSEPVKYLANGTRFKMSFFENIDQFGRDTEGTHVTCFESFEDEIDGRWVALVAAENDMHLNATSPAAPLPEPLSVKQIHDWWASENGLEDCDMCKLKDFAKVVQAVEKRHNIGAKEQ